MVLSLESLVQTLESLNMATGGDRVAHTLIEQRLHLSRGKESEFELFIEGDLDSFGEEMIGGFFSWGSYHDLNTNRDIKALVISADNRSGHSRLLAHVAYESVRILSNNPDIDNESLLIGISPFLSLIVQTQVMSVPKQMGLTGELILMEQLLSHANEKGIPHSRVMNAWKGYLNSDRDFYRNGIAIEVKASGSRTRVHSISSITQLLIDEQAGEERLFVFSIGLKPDASREYKLVTQIDNVTRILSSEQHSEFFDYLGNYCGEGYNRSLRDRYNLETGFSVFPTGGLIEMNDRVDILRYSSFVSGRLPSNVENISYKARFEEPSLSRSAIEDIYSEMLSHRQSRSSNIGD